MSFKTTLNALVDQLRDLAVGPQDTGADMEEPSETGTNWQLVSKSDGAPRQSTKAQSSQIDEQSQHAEQYSTSGYNTKSKQMLDQSQSLLFMLPTEIRLTIFELVMCHEPLGEAVSRQRCARHGTSSSSDLDLLRTCRRILSEAEPVFFSRDKFSLSREKIQTLAGLSLRRRCAMTSVMVTIVSAGQTYEVLRKLSLLPKLKSLHLHRAMSARYMDIRDWRVMKKQHIAAIGEFSDLSELRVTTPEIGNGASEHEIAMDQQRLQLEAEWQKAVKNAK